VEKEGGGGGGGLSGQRGGGVRLTPSKVYALFTDSVKKKKKVFLFLLFCWVMLFQHGNADACVFVCVCAFV